MKRLFIFSTSHFSQIQIHGNHHISFSNFSVTLDFGGFAKGYALKKIQEILLRGNIENAFVDFGNSSIMGIGHHPYGDCWKVSLQNPYTQQTLDEFCLTDNTLSTSGNTEQYTGHIINPLTGIYNEQKKVTSILSDNPLDAEILSTVWMIADDQQREQINENFKHIKGTIYTL